MDFLYFKKRYATRLHADADPHATLLLLIMHQLLANTPPPLTPRSRNKLNIPSQQEQPSPALNRILDSKLSSKIAYIAPIANQHPRNDWGSGNSPPMYVLSKLAVCEDVSGVQEWPLLQALELLVEHTWTLPPSTCTIHDRAFCNLRGCLAHMTIDSNLWYALLRPPCSPCTILLPVHASETTPS